MAGDSVVPEMIFFVSFTLLISLIIISLKKKIKIPATIMMVGSGILLRYVTKFLPEKADTYKLADNIDNNFLLFVFIPPLIFETAISLEWYTFKKQFFQILLLATTGVVITTALIASVSALVFIDHDYGLRTYLVFGAILSATDHVSIVSQLNEHHVEHKLSTLIQGETLLNEATVLVLLTMFSDSYGVNRDTIELGAEHFFKLTLGGLFIGGLLAGLMMLWLQNIINEPTQEVTVTIVTTYLAFYFADGTGLHFSGAIAVATVGLTMSAFGKTTISPKSENAMHIVWSLISRNIESLIFLISGMIFAKAVLIEDVVTWDHYLRYIAIFLLCYICRAITMAIHYPILRKLGYGLSFKELVTLSFSGLKGSITVILSLVIYKGDITSEDDTAFIIIGCLVITILSMITDTFLLSKIVSFFEVGKISIVQENLLIQVTSALVHETYEEIEKLSKSEDGKFSDWECVHEVAGSKKLINSLFSNSKVGQKILKASENSENESEFELIRAFSNEVKLKPEQILTELRRRFLTMMKGIYWHTFDAGQCFRLSLLHCAKATNISLDHENEPLNTWKELRKLSLPKLYMKIFKFGSKVPGVKKFSKRLLYERLALAYDSAKCFIDAHHEVAHFLKSMHVYFADYQHHIADIIQESHKEVEACKEYIIHHITSTYPEILRYVQTYKSCHSVLNVQRKLIEKFMHHGLINDIEYEKLAVVLDKNLEGLVLSYEPKIPNTYDILQSVFPNVPEAMCRKLASNTSEVFFNEGDILFNKGDSTQGAYIILKGCTREFTDDFEEKQTIGFISGVQHLIRSLNVNITTCQAITTTIALRVNLNNVEMSPEFEKEIWMKAAKKIFIINKDDFGSLFEGMTDENICKFTSECKYATYKHSDIVKVKSGGLLLNGKLDIFKAYHFIAPENYEELECIGDVVFMHLPIEIINYIKSDEAPATAINSYLNRNTTLFGILSHIAISAIEPKVMPTEQLRRKSEEQSGFKVLAAAKYLMFQTKPELKSNLLQNTSINY